MAFLTFVTTCRGRLAHLRETLPSLAAQPDTHVVVVDYNCPERSGDWVEAHFPNVEVVRSPESPRFELARARNLGAPKARSPWICFIDADTRAASDFSERIKPVLAAGHFYQAVPPVMETWGTSICAAADFELVGGYDEVIQGWGREDDDFYARLLLAGIRYASFPADVLQVTTHTDRERVAHYDVKDRWVNESINHVYCRAKIDLMMLKRAPLALDKRRQLYAQVRAAVIEARQSGKTLRIALPLRTQETRACGPMESSLVYTLPRPRGESRPNTFAGSLISRSLRQRLERP